MRLRVDARKAPAGLLRELRLLMKDFPGDAAVIMNVDTSLGPKVLELGSGYRVSPTPAFFGEVKALLGEAAVA